ncbi:MAG: glycosyltransferase [Epsilonproteobacteria bacterium]|nr:glycosyltransferase [Campylobacterota bacterium]
MFVMPSLTGGGAERVMLTLVKHIDRERFTPIFVLTKKEGHFLSVLPKDIEVIDLNALQARYAIFKIAKSIHKIKPDIVFSTLGYLNLLIALIRPFFSKEIIFISRESNTVSIENRQEKYPKLFDWLYKKVYNNFDLIITQSKYMRDDLVANFGTQKEKIAVVYNPVDIDLIQTHVDSEEKIVLPNDKYNLLAVGRLAPQKGFDLLIESMYYLDDKYHLTILGEGDDEKILKEKIHTLGVENKVTMAGFSNNPYKYMHLCDLFVLSSRYEGLPNVVLEANATKTPSVSMDMPGGTAEIIEEGKTGYLVKSFDAKSLAQRIEEAKEHTWDANYIKNYCETNFKVRKIVKTYEMLFLKGVRYDGS